MAVTPQDNSGFLREVDEEVRRDRAAQFWSRWGLWIAIGLVVALAALGGWMYWQHSKTMKAEAETTELAGILKDLDEGRLEGVEGRLDALIESDRPGVRAAALFTRAGYALQSGNQDEAARLFGQAAGDESLPRQYRDLALIRQTTTEFDSLQPQQVIDRMAALAQPGNPWFGSAGELTAAALIKQNKSDAAGQMFKRIAGDETVPETLRTRAVQMAGVLGVDAVPDEPIEIEASDTGAPAQPAAPEEVEE